MPQVAGLYAATKAFVISLSENLWFEHKARGVNGGDGCIEPGRGAGTRYDGAGDCRGSDNR